MKRDGLRWLRVGLGIAVFILVLVVLSWVGWIDWEGVWKWLRGKESESTTIRNLGLVIGGFIAIWLTLRRIRVADRQAQTAQHGLMNERYQQATEMLGSDVLTVRLGGIYALQGLAEEDPEQYHVQIMRLFCAFVRHPVKDKEADKENQAKPLLREEDVQAIMDAIATRSGTDIELEKKANDFRPDLRGAHLRGVYLIYGNLSRADLSPPPPFSTSSPGADLSQADLIGTDLSEANLSGADLSGARLSDARLSDARLNGAYLNGTDLSGANLSGAVLFGTTGLTQAQLDKAGASPDNPPGGLQLARDAETKEPLVWNERPL